MSIEEKNLRYQSASTILSGLLAGRETISPGEEQKLAKKALDLAALLDELNGERQKKINKEWATGVAKALKSKA